MSDRFSGRRSAAFSRRRRLLALSLATGLLLLPVVDGPPGIAAEDAAVHGRIDVIQPAPEAVRCPDRPAAVPVSAWGITPVRQGRIFSLTADDGSWRDDFDISFFGSEEACRAGRPLPHRNHAGDENAVVPVGARLAVVTLHAGGPGAAFTYRELPDAPALRREHGELHPPVIAVLEPYYQTIGAVDSAKINGFSPYHNDFLASKHPWKSDEDPATKIDLNVDPATYLPGYPGATPLELHLPTSDDAKSDDLYNLDKSTWAGMTASTAKAPSLYRFPGTKIVAITHFAGAAVNSDMYQNNEAHGTKAASVAAGNLNGTCPECLLVLVRFEEGRADEALEWATKQRWIDVVTNSYLRSWQGKDGIFIGEAAPVVDASRRGTVQGQTVVWGAGNGLDTAMAVPGLTYLNGQTGPDWGVVVGGVTSNNDQSLGSHRPVDIAAYAHDYPSAGGAAAGSRSEFDGTSNAAPVVAGTFAKVIHMARQLVGDTTPGNHDGIVAEGEPVRCKLVDCPLDDGVLKRSELDRVVFHNVLPSPRRDHDVRPFAEVGELPAAKPDIAPSGGDQAMAAPVQYPLTSTPSVFPTPAQGHGIVYGTWDRPRLLAERRRFLDALRGAVAPYSRPPGEATWMMADSKCRQQLWGAWDEGYYTERRSQPGHEDSVAPAWDAWCSTLSPGVMLTTPLATRRCVISRPPTGCTP